MITTTFSNSKAIEINGKRFKPGASYTFTQSEWDNFFEKSFFKVYEPIIEEIIGGDKSVKEIRELKTKKEK